MARPGEGRTEPTAWGAVRSDALLGKGTGVRGGEEVVTWSVQARRRPVLRPAMFRDPKWHESCGMPEGDSSKANFSSTNLPYSVEINEYYLNAEKKLYA